MQRTMNMMNSMTPEQRRAMAQEASSMNPDLISQQATRVHSTLSAREKYLYDASEKLKKEGNVLHGQKNYAAAIEKYERAIDNLNTSSSSCSIALSTSCWSNMASCYLQLEKWVECVESCKAVLHSTAATPQLRRKALYRRGRALASMGRFNEAIDDLKKALEMSPEDEKALIQEKLDEVLAKKQQGSQGFSIEEIDPQSDEKGAITSDEGTTTGNDAPGGTAKAKENGDSVAFSDANVVEVDINQDQEEASAAKDPTVVQEPLASARGDDVTSSTETKEMNTHHLGRGLNSAAERLQEDPTMVKQVAEIMEEMSDAELTAYLSSSGRMLPGFTPDMARMAANMMKNMPSEQLQDVAKRASTMMQTNPDGNFPQTTYPVDDATGRDSVSSSTDFKEYPNATVHASVGNLPTPGSIPGDPESLKAAARMMETMSPQQLEHLATSMPGAPQGIKIDASQMKMAAKMMESMSPEDLQRMTCMARSMNLDPSSANSSAQPSMDRAVAKDERGSLNAPSPSSFGLPPMAPGNYSDLRKQMANPEMLRSMQGMLKNMDPEGLASMMSSAMGRPVTAEQARQMVEQMGKISDTHLHIISRLMKVINAVIGVYNSVKAFATSHAAMTMAIVVLVIAVVLRWLGWL